MSETTSFLSEIVERRQIPPNKLAFFESRLRHSLFDYILGKFAEREESEGLTKAELARRIGCDPALITRWLGAPGNWTLDTVSNLLLGIAGEELVPSSRPVASDAKRNYDGITWGDKPSKNLHSITKNTARTFAATADRVSSELLSKPSKGLTGSKEIETRSREQFTNTRPGQSILDAPVRR